MRSFLPSVALVSAAFLLGCQEHGITAPEAQPTVLMEVAAPVAVSASGTIVSLNRAEKHGVIERDDVGTLYQFAIPGDLGGVTTPAVGNPVFFTIDPEVSKHATNVFVRCTPPACDPT